MPRATLRARLHLDRPMILQYPAKQGIRSSSKQFHIVIVFFTQCMYTRYGYSLRRGEWRGGSSDPAPEANPTDDQGTSVGRVYDTVRPHGLPCLCGLSVVPSA